MDGIAKACNVSAITASTTRAVLPLNDDVLPQLTRWDGGLGCKRGAHPRIPQFFSLFGQGISPAAVPPTLGARQFMRARTAQRVLHLWSMQAT